jgi:hypothetical protein
MGEIASARGTLHAFDRVKPLDAILATAEKKGLHRTLGAFQLTMLGIGAVIGTGIFVLTSEAAQKAGPGMLLSFVVAGFVCAVAALCYSELASMVPVSGSAYTYTYAVVGELLAWMVGWALILEYAVGASAVAVGWSNHAVGLLKGSGIAFPAALSNADALMAQVQLAFGATPSPDLTTALQVGGWINVPAIVISASSPGCCDRHDRERARQRGAGRDQDLALTAFIILTIPVMNAEQFHRPSCRPAGRRARRRGVDLLRLCRLRRGLDRGRGNQEPAAQRADRPDRIAAHLHALLPAGRIGRDRRDRRAAGDGPAGHPARPARPRWPGRCARSSPAARSSRSSAPRKRWSTC